MKPKVSIFVKEELVVLNQIRAFKDKLLNPLADLIFKMRISANTLTFLGFLQIIPFSWAMSQNNYLVASVAIILHILFDSLDGTVARKTNTENKWGTFLDQFNDNIVFVLMVLVMIYFRQIAAFWYSFYLVQHLILFFFLLLLQQMRAKFFPAFRLKYGFYVIFFLFSISHIDWFLPFAVFASVYTLVSNCFLFFSLKDALSN